MAEIHHEIKIKASSERIFGALTTAEGLKSWHSAHVEGDGATGHAWRFEFTGRPTFRWEITESAAPTRVAKGNGAAARYGFAASSCGPFCFRI
jgi:uncharacterized protein YndB with AHSA1/START domain